jgi:hypothetical protein
MFKIRRKVMLSNRHIIFVPVIVLFLTAGLYADGCFVWRKGADLNEPTQKALIYWKKGKEIMVLQVKYEGAAEDFAWIVPLPAKPKVSAIDAEKSPFAEISLYTQLRRRWGYRGKDAGAEAEAKVTVLERKIVGVYDIAILAASDAKALGEWLNNNGYAFPEKRKDVLEHYTKKKWVYVAMRIDRKALESDEVKKLKSGELQPIRFSFAAKEMVYPLKISSVNAGETEVLLYVLADAPMVVKGEHKQAGFSIEKNMCWFPRYQDHEYGTYRKTSGDELPLTWEALGLAKNKELSLCKYRAVYKVEEMTNDLTFARFEPRGYWKQRLRETEARNYYWLKRCALCVLAYHDAELLQKLARDKDEYLRMAAAHNPKASRQILLELAGDEQYSVRLSVARNVNTPVVLLRKLAKDKNKLVRGEVALNPNAPRDVFRILVQDKENSVREALVRNPYVPSEVLRKLAEVKDEEVRYYVAIARMTLINVLYKLSKDKNAHVRMGIAYNYNTPEELLRILTKDEDSHVSKAAKSVLKRRGF